jgi:alpha-L-fucosidase
MTLNGHWGYKKGDENWKPTKQLVQTMIDIASKGGNFLLNVGPTGEGLIPQPSVEHLNEVGQWMKVNGEAIYGTSGSSFEKPAWGRFTKRVSGGETTLYVHVFDWPKGGKLIIKELARGADSVTLLSDGRKVEHWAGDSGLTISLPAEPPDAISSTIGLRLKKPL